jgi:hypothetical protein
MFTPRNYQYFGGHPFLQRQPKNNTRREFPEVDTTMFTESAVVFRQLMRDASQVLDELADHKNFANEVMYAAQLSDTTKVEKLIESTGIKSKVVTTYNPDGITLTFNARVEDTDCCKLTMTLRW